MDKIPFNKPYMTGNEVFCIEEAHRNASLAGDGSFTKRCHAWIENNTGASKALLTHSCTAALEMASILLQLEQGDEVIMPSYTFVSTANAFVLRGAVPVFVDIRCDTLNLDETKVEASITNKTKAIVPVHYAGVACEMDSLITIAESKKIEVIEDAAQGVLAKYKNQPLGAIGDLGAYSFHETKNVISGEGGALLVKSAELGERAEIIREKGTDRSRFFRGQVDKYTWQEVGSSFLPGELIAAFLWAQLEQAEKITSRRMEAWNVYHGILASSENAELLRRPIVPSYCEHNAHMYYVLLPEGVDRTRVLAELNSKGINAVFHYIPLHSSPAGQRYARYVGAMKNTNELSARLVRLPLWVGITEEQQIRVCEELVKAIQKQL